MVVHKAQWKAGLGENSKGLRRSRRQQRLVPYSRAWPSAEPVPQLLYVHTELLLTAQVPPDRRGGVAARNP